MRRSGKSDRVYVRSAQQGSAQLNKLNARIAEISQNVFSIAAIFFLLSESIENTQFK